MAFDFKKEYKEFYMPKNKPEIVTVPKANYIAVRGKGDPNEADGAYQKAIQVLYAVAYTIKMSYKTDYRIQGFYEYVVPPLEGFWWQGNVEGVDYSDKSNYSKFWNLLTSFHERAWNDIDMSSMNKSNMKGKVTFHKRNKTSV